MILVINLELLYLENDDNLLVSGTPRLYCDHITRYKLSIYIYYCDTQYMNINKDMSLI